ncbi:MAG: hemerythrin domain-containing protein [Promethearchaeota archaeon]|jgi:hypothetical protein
MTQPRFDVYGPVHKGLRFFMTELMYELGKSDVNNVSELTSLEEKLQYLWDILKVHAEGEEEFIFPHLESEDKALHMKLKQAHEKFHKQAEIFSNDFRNILGTDSEDTKKLELMSKFIKRYNTFLFEYFSHLQDEELEANPVLWKILGDEELMVVISKISSKPTPELRQYFLPYLLKATNHPERVGVLMGMKKDMSESAFNGILNIARTSLVESNWQKLKQTLDTLI